MFSSAPLSKKPKLSVEVDDLSLHPQLIQKLKEAKLYSWKTVLHLSQSELQRIAKVSSSEAKLILGVVSHVLLGEKIVSAYSLLHDGNLSTKQKLSLRLLENFDRNCEGIYTGTITEICGESGSGKTQLCLHLSIHAQKPDSDKGLNSKVIYVHSEGEFPIKRYLQMAQSFKQDNPKLQNLRLTDNLILRKVFNLQEIMHVLQKGIPDMLQKFNKPKMIIIDSVAALLRCEYESPSSRTSMIQKFSIEIWKLANLYGMAVICVNQVSGSNKSNQVTNMTSDIPSLGLLWSNILTTRMKVSRKASEDFPTRRILEIIFSSYLPHIATNFAISETGIRVL